MTFTFWRSSASYKTSLTKKRAKMKFLDYSNSSRRFKFKHGKGANDGEF